MNAVPTLPTYPCRSVFLTGIRIFQPFGFFAFQQLQRILRKNAESVTHRAVLLIRTAFTPILRAMLKPTENLFTVSHPLHRLSAIDFTANKIAPSSVSVKSGFRSVDSVIIVVLVAVSIVGGSLMTIVFAFL